MPRPVMTDADRHDGFRGLAHAGRRKILAMLGQNDLTVTQILEQTKFTQPAMSRHLAILRETGLVTVRKVGSRHQYRLNRPALRRIVKQLQPLA